MLHSASGSSCVASVVVMPYIYIRPDGRRVVISMHSGTELKRKTLRAIIDEMRITVEEFTTLM